MSKPTSATCCLTCEELLAHFEGIHDGRDDALYGAKHAAQAQVDQHEEEHDRPEGWRWEMRHGLREGNEGQPRPLHRLHKRGDTIHTRLSEGKWTEPGNLGAPLTDLNLLWGSVWPQAPGDHLFCP